MKCAWYFLITECDNIGVWGIDMDSMSFHLGEEVTASELEIFNSDKKRIAFFLPHKLLILDFLMFQSCPLSKKCGPHGKIFKSIDSLSIAYPEIHASLVFSLKEEKGKEEVNMNIKGEEKMEGAHPSNVSFDDAFSKVGAM